MSQTEIVQLTVVHKRNDIRIVYREVYSIAQSQKWAPVLMVADGEGSGTHEIADIRVPVCDIGKSSAGRLGRAILGTLRAVRAIRRIRPALVHFHDPELIPTGLILKLLGYKVIYDVHEDVPRDILDKFWLPRPFRRVLAAFAGTAEWFGARIFDALVCATPTIADRFPSGKTIVVQNFPIPSEFFVASSVPYGQRDNVFVYIGVITELRGANEMFHALGLLTPRASCWLELAGAFRPASLEDGFRALPAWERVRYHGWATRSQVAALLGRAKAGIVVLHPTTAYLDAYPIKMFEYMAAGLPVIASDFPLWRKIVEDAGCGLLVDPLDPKAAAVAMQWIVDNPEEAEQMGQRGRKAVEEKYNWAAEGQKLLTLYTTLLDR